MIGKISYYVAKDADPLTGVSKIFGEEDAPRELLIPLYCEGGRLLAKPKESTSLPTSIVRPDKQKFEFPYSEREKRRLRRRKKQGQDPEKWMRLSSGGSAEKYKKAEASDLIGAGGPSRDLLEANEESRAFAVSMGFQAAQHAHSCVVALFAALPPVIWRADDLVKKFEDLGAVLAVRLADAAEAQIQQLKQDTASNCDMSALNLGQCACLCWEPSGLPSQKERESRLQALKREVEMQVYSILSVTTKRLRQQVASAKEKVSKDEEKVDGVVRAEVEGGIQADAAREGADLYAMLEADAMVAAESQLQAEAEAAEAYGSQGMYRGDADGYAAAVRSFMRQVERGATR